MPPITLDWDEVLLRILLQGYPKSDIPALHITGRRCRDIFALAGKG